MQDLDTFDAFHWLDAFADDRRQILDQSLVECGFPAGIGPKVFGNVDLFLAVGFHPQAFFQGCHSNSVSIRPILCRGLLGFGQDTDAGPFGLGHALGLDEFDRLLTVGNFGVTDRLDTLLRLDHRPAGVLGRGLRLGPLLGFQRNCNFARLFIQSGGLPALDIKRFKGRFHRNPGTLDGLAFLQLDVFDFPFALRILGRDQCFLLGPLDRDLGLVCQSCIFTVAGDLQAALLRFQVLGPDRDGSVFFDVIPLFLAALDLLRQPGQALGVECV